MVTYNRIKILAALIILTLTGRLHAMNDANNLASIIATALYWEKTLSSHDPKSGNFLADNFLTISENLINANELIYLAAKQPSMAPAAGSVYPVFASLYDYLREDSDLSEVSNFADMLDLVVQKISAVDESELATRNLKTALGQEIVVKVLEQIANNHRQDYHIFFNRRFAAFAKTYDLPAFTPNQVDCR